MIRFGWLKKIYYRWSGYSYTNLGRLFLRLFVGLMFLQFGVRQILHFDECGTSFPSVLGMSPEAGCVVMICIEVVCSLFIMCGFLTRFMTIPPFLSMAVAEYYLLDSSPLPASDTMLWTQSAYLPVMFLGIYFFIMLVGPGKISIDYFLSLHFIHNDNMSEKELEEV